MAHRKGLRPAEILALLNDLEEGDSEGEGISEVVSDSDYEEEIDSNSSGQSESGGQSSSDEDASPAPAVQQGNRRSYY